MADLARRGPVAVQKDGGIREFLAFKLAEDFYAVDLTRIREILSPPPVTPVPRAPGDVLGVCSVRGLLVTVVDLRRRLKLEELPPSRQTRILLAQTETDEVIGLYVDEVRQVVRLAESEIEVAQTVLGGELSDHVVGIGRPQSVQLTLSSRPDQNILILLNLSTIVNR